VEVGAGPAGRTSRETSKSIRTCRTPLSCSDVGKSQAQLERVTIQLKAALSTSCRRRSSCSSSRPPLTATPSTSDPTAHQPPGIWVPQITRWSASRKRQDIATTGSAFLVEQHRHSCQQWRRILRRFLAQAPRLSARSRRPQCSQVHQLRRLQRSVHGLAHLPRGLRGHPAFPRLPRLSCSHGPARCCSGRHRTDRSALLSTRLGALRRASQVCR